jgi:hypothetical protein
MAHLTVRNLEQDLIRRLKEQAASHGVSVNEEIRRILRSALPARPQPKMSFGEFLTAPPFWDDDFCELLTDIVKSRR